MRDLNESRAPECADEAMRDALPALDHGRLPMVERQAVEAHVSVCAPCAEELALLRDVRQSVAAATPRLDLDRLAAAVAAATRPALAEGADVIPIAPRLAARQAAPARGWMRGGMRAAAAALLMVAGVGAVTLARRGQEPGDAPGASPVVATAPARSDGAGAAAPATLATASPQAGPATGGAPARGTHVLGERFDDLSDAELDAVLLAIDDEEAELPALEPAVHASEYRGGGA
ncbi:MAG: zf-HC2 domain-containing protein [Gemmatirosa sp.]